MSKTIRIDGEGDGQWVMEQVGGVFSAGYDHSFITLQDGARRLGGFVLCHYLGASATIHMAGVDEKWCSRDLLWLVFHYSFVQLGLRKLLAPVASSNHIALAQNLRAGWRIEAIIRDAYRDAHLMLLGMDRENCPWLRIKPKQWQAGSAAAEKEIA